MLLTHIIDISAQILSASVGSTPLSAVRLDGVGADKISSAFGRHVAVVGLISFFVGVAGLLAALIASRGPARRETNTIEGRPIVEAERIERY
jgi:hypothetical protein